MRPGQTASICPPGSIRQLGETEAGKQLNGSTVECWHYLGAHITHTLQLNLSSGASFGFGFGSGNKLKTLPPTPPRPLNDRHTTPNPQWSDSPMCIHQRWGIVFKWFWGAVHHRRTQWEQITLHVRHMLLITWKWRLWRIQKLCCVMINALIITYASVGEGKGVARFSGASLSALHPWDNPPNQVWHPCLGNEAPLGCGRCSVWRLSVWGHL